MEFVGEVGSEHHVWAGQGRSRLGDKMCRTIDTGVKPKLLLGKGLQQVSTFKGTHPPSSRDESDSPKSHPKDAGHGSSIFKLRLPGPSSPSRGQKPILTAFDECKSVVDVPDISEAVWDTDKLHIPDTKGLTAGWQDTNRLMALPTDSEFRLGSSCQGDLHSDYGVVSLAQVPTFGDRVHYPEPAPAVLNMASIQRMGFHALPEESEINDRHEIETNRDVEKLLEQVPELVAFRHNKQLPISQIPAASQLNQVSQVSWNPLSQDHPIMPSTFTFQ